MEKESNEQGTIRYIRCPSCGAPNPAAALTCSRCAKPLAASDRPAAAALQPVVCPKCRNSLPAGSKFCGFCGSPLPAAPPAPPAKPAAAPARAAAPAAKPPAPAPAAAKASVPAPAKPKPGPAAPPPAASGPQSPQGTVAFTGLTVPRVEASFSEVKQDGTTGKTVRVSKEMFIGRAHCDASYPSDALLSPRHASLAVRKGKLVLKDLESQNGTFIKLRQDTELKAGDVFLLGRELFRFTTQSPEGALATPQGTVVMSGAPKLQAGPVTAKLEHIQLSGELIEELKLEKPETTLGRTTGDLVFKNDPYMSGMHARIIAQSGRFTLQDLKSTNGIYRRIRGEAELADGDEFFLGEQRFRIALKVS